MTNGTALPRVLSVVARDRPAMECKMDFGTTKRQIGIGNLMACGARDFIGDREKRSLMFRVGPSGRLRKIIVTLDPSDTYSVRYVEMKRSPSYAVVVDETKTGVYCDQLGAVVRKMGDR